VKLAVQFLANAVIAPKKIPSKVVECLVGRDRERGILIVVRDSGTGFPGQFPVARLGKMFIPITAAGAM
jgi:hypothetical protein